MKIALIIILLYIASSTCISAADTVHVDLLNEHQTILGNGINFEGYHRSGGGELLKAKFTTMLNTINSQLLRIGMPLREWEPANDDADAYNFNWSAFRQTSAVTNSFKRIQQLDADGYHLWLAIWDVANWNVKNPGDGSARRIKDMNEFVESLTAYLLTVKNEYGVDIMYVSVNEPSVAAENGWGGYQIALTAEEQAELILKAGARFKELGLSTKWLVALHKVYPSELAQAQQIYETPGVLEYIGGFDFHGYWWQNGHDKELAAWADWTTSTGLPNFAGECDYDNQFWKRESSDKAQWVHAEETAKLLYKMYTVARAEGLLLWYADAPTSSRPYRYANKHFYDVMNPGCILVDAQPTTKLVYATAIKHNADDDFAIILQNNSTKVRDITLVGIPNETMTQRQSYNGNYYKMVSSTLTPVNGALTITLAGQSINTISGKGGDVPSSVKTELDAQPASYSLKLNYPNPFNPTTRIEYELDQSAHITLEIYNAVGQRIRTITDQTQDAGIYNLVWDAKNDMAQAVAAGVYIARLTIESNENNAVDSVKMLLLK